MANLCRRSLSFLQSIQRSTNLTSVVVRRTCSSNTLENVSEQSPGLTDIRLSDSCVERLKEIGLKGKLRVFVEGGGCSGFQYKFELDSAFDPKEDVLISRNGVDVVVDTESMTYLKGATIDFGEELIRSAFRIVNNPLAEQGCSCGASFNVKL